MQTELQGYAKKRGSTQQDFELVKGRRGHAAGAHKVLNPAYGKTEFAVAAQIDVVYAGKGVPSYSRVGKELKKPEATSLSFTRALGSSGYVSGKSDRALRRWKSERQWRDHVAGRVEKSSSSNNSHA